MASFGLRLADSIDVECGMKVKASRQFSRSRKRSFRTASRSVRRDVWGREEVEFDAKKDYGGLLLSSRRLAVPAKPGSSDARHIT